MITKLRQSARSSQRHGSLVTDGNGVPCIIKSLANV